MGATHFLTKTLPRVAAEMAPHVLAYNLTRVMNIMGTQPLLAAMRATTSAWYTAANTVPSKAIPAAAAISPPPTKYVSNRISQAPAGHAKVHQGVCATTMPMSLN